MAYNLHPQLVLKAKQLARAHFAKTVLDKLRAKRLAGAVAPPEEKKSDDPGGYDALQEMLNRPADGEQEE